MRLKYLQVNHHGSTKAEQEKSVHLRVQVLYLIQRFIFLVCYCEHAGYCVSALVFGCSCAHVRVLSVSTACLPMCVMCVWPCSVQRSQSALIE